MKAVLDRLSALPFFSGLKQETRNALSEKGIWRSVPGGWTLFDQGEEGEALHFLLAGRLLVVRHTPTGDETIGYIRPGEPVGEMSLLMGATHSASVYALRDSEVLSVERSAFSNLLKSHGELAGAIARLSLMRARSAPQLKRKRAPKIFAFIASSPSIDIEGYARRLAVEISAIGVAALSLSEESFAQATDTGLDLDRLENEHDVLILPARVGNNSWYRFVLRHCDRFVVFARQDARPPRPFPMSARAGERARRFRLVDLVMLNEGMRSCETLDWMTALKANRVFHLRSDRCVGRLARIMAGRSVGLVLSGGGARAYAHIGVLRALKSAGIEIDTIGGASMGAIIAACVASGWDMAEVEERIKQAFVKSNPLGDFTLPVVALTRGARVDQRLKTHFGETLIEDLALPFYCVSSELTQGALAIHKHGVLRQALRASISLPGVLPPVVWNGGLHVDGAVLDNYPTELMDQRHRGVTIGVDVAQSGTIEANAFIEPPNFFQWVWRNGLRSAPPIVGLLMRSATARHEHESASAFSPDIEITPKVRGVELRDWKKYDLAVEDGYATAMTALEKQWPQLERALKGATLGL